MSEGKLAVSTLLGISVSKKGEPAYSSTELVRDFVHYTAELSVEEAAALADVSTATLSRWRMMGARQLRADVRRRLLKYVAEREKGVRCAA